MPDYLPRADRALATWARNFADRVVPAPYAYGLTPIDAGNLAAAVTRFLAALTRATEPATRTAPAIADKDVERDAMEAVLRNCALRIKSNLGVSNEEKIALGLRLDPPAHLRGRPLPAPRTSPRCTVSYAAPFRHLVRIADSEAPDRCAKPHGAAYALLAYYLTDDPTAPPPDPTTLPSHDLHLVTRGRIAIDLPRTARGQSVVYLARWASRTGKWGPWGAPVALDVA